MLLVVLLPIVIARTFAALITPMFVVTMTIAAIRFGYHFLFVWR
jgi:hypothetical protein